ATLLSSIDATSAREGIRSADDQLDRSRGGSDFYKPVPVTSCLIKGSGAVGIPFDVTAYGVNQICGSGLRTVALGYQAIRNCDSEIVVAGGQESMSQAPHCIHLRNGVKMGNAELVDTMMRDGLWDAFNGYHMGNTAEN